MKIIILARALLRQNSWFVAIFQAALIFVSLVLAWFLRFDFTLPNRRLLFTAACILILLRMLTISSFGLLHGWWRYTGLSDSLEVFKAVVSGSFAFVLTIRYLLDATGFPRSIFVLEPVLTAAMLIGVRLFSRVLAESVRQDLTASKKVLLVGAGVGGQTVVRELRDGKEYAVLGYVDDDRSKTGLKIDDVPVLGTVDALPDLVESYPVDEILIAVPSASSKQMQRFVQICERSKVKFRTVPALRDVIADRVSISHFRNVDVEDLLGRDPVEIDLHSVRGTIQGHTVLVTGAAGSIGSELCRQILSHQPQTLVCVDHDESAMFYLGRDLSARSGGAVVRCHVADVCDRREMDHIFRETRPRAIFHAAAYKHVPLMEINASAAVQNNVFGLVNLLSVASGYDCKTFILISSDKAVNPTSVMGATKRICELIIAHRPTNGMRCLSVRFGNVLGSNGSVIPVLQRQLRHNEPLTVTHAEMKRFFMTIREAVSLVLQASVIGEKGDTLVLDMGEPVPIMELVQTLIKLSGKNENDVDVVFTGLREGEKLVEELFYTDEQVSQTTFPKIKRARGPMQSWEALARQLDALEATLFVNGSASVRSRIKDIVKEYSCPGGQPPRSIAILMPPYLSPNTAPGPSTSTIPPAPAIPSASILP
ncbi:MAG TPA: nucleoside-diphosphate sugar epimerase/dehydratase [Verrucomicrobiae bacterium]|nr:nucleoside-diphosphate sugar epimerase/dehydratase [Verrucomicrobiae bacterium]